MDLSNAFQILAISLGLGLLVGAQRERVDAPLAGIRTFGLITLFGTLCGLLAIDLGPWVVVAGLVGVAIAVGVGNLLFLKQSRPDSGITTEIAILLMYGVGAYLAFGHRSVAVVIGGAVAVLLHAKPVLHRLVNRLGESDMRVMMQFVLISLVILPVLPDRAFGPFGVLNPREIWWMVVLVVAISLGGYVALKLFGDHTGVMVAGLIGGLVSSTATTVSSARRTTGTTAAIAASTLIILLASTVLFARVIVEVVVVAPGMVRTVVPRIAILLAVSAALCAVLWGWSKRQRIEPPAHENPTQMRPALVFGAAYALVLLAVAAARHYLGDRGVYVAAAISGLTDLDAITLSTSRLGERGMLAPGVVWRAIVIALLSNLAFKTGVVLFLAGLPPARRIALLFAIPAAVGLVMLLMS